MGVCPGSACRRGGDRIPGACLACMAQCQKGGATEATLEVIGFQQ